MNLDFNQKLTDKRSPKTAGTRTLVTSHDECVKYAQSNEDIDAFILDVMLPSDVVFSFEESNRFQITGLLLGKVIRELFPNIPIVFFSIAGARNSELHKTILNSTKTMKNVFFISKSEVFPNEFVKIVQDAISGVLKLGKSHSVSQALGESIILQPNVAGIGIDLKKIVTSLIEHYKRDKDTNA